MNTSSQNEDQPSKQLEAEQQEVATKLGRLQGMLAALSGAICLAFLPLTYQHLIEGGSGHWTTTVWPLVALVFAFARGKRIDGSRTTKNRVLLSLVTFSISTLLGVYACWYFIGWCGLIACIGCLTAYSLLRLDNSWAEVFGWSLLASVAAGIPYELFPGVEVWLRGVSVATASAFLDLIGTPNLLSGTLLEVQGLKIFSAQVLSGIANAQFVVGMCMAMAIYWRQSLFVGIKLIVHAGIWLCFANVVKLLVIVYFHTTGDRDLTSGLDLILLSIATLFLAAFLCYFSMLTLQLLTAPVVGTVEEFGPALESLNSLLRWPQPIPARVGGGKLRSAGKERKPKPINLSLLTTTSRVFLIGTGFLALAGVACLGVLRNGTASPLDVESLPNVVAMADSVELPADRRDLRRIVEKDEEGEKQDSGLRWRYFFDGRVVDFSVEQPLQGWVDPAESLTQIGWQVQRSAKLKDDWPYIVMALKTDLGSNAFLFVSCMDEKGEQIDLLPEVNKNAELERFRSTNNLWDLLKGKPSFAVVPNAQIRLYTELGEGLTNEERQSLLQQLEKLYVEFREALVAGTASET
ncbi:MAG: exosortase U [Aureliella sp.]